MPATDIAQREVRLAELGEAEDKAGGLVGGSWSSERGGCALPFQPLLGAIGKRSTYGGGNFQRRCRERSGLFFDNQPGIALLLPRDNLRNDHRSSGRERFLDGSAACLADEKMTFRH
jgi:hypothetical protein